MKKSDNRLQPDNKWDSTYDLTLLTDGQRQTQIDIFTDTDSKACTRAKAAKRDYATARKKKETCKDFPVGGARAFIFFDNFRNHGKRMLIGEAYVIQSTKICSMSFQLSSSNEFPSFVNLVKSFRFTADPPAPPLTDKERNEYLTANPNNNFYFLTEYDPEITVIALGLFVEHPEDPTFPKARLYLFNTPPNVILQRLKYEFHHQQGWLRVEDSDGKLTYLNKEKQQVCYFQYMPPLIQMGYYPKRKVRCCVAVATRFAILDWLTALGHA